MALQLEEEEMNEDGEDEILAQPMFLATDLSTGKLSQMIER